MLGLGGGAMPKKKGGGGKEEEEIKAEEKLQAVVIAQVSSRKKLKLLTHRRIPRQIVAQQCHTLCLGLSKHTRTHLQCASSVPAPAGPKSAVLQQQTHKVVARCSF